MSDLSFGIISALIFFNFALEKEVDRKAINTLSNIIK